MDKKERLCKAIKKIGWGYVPLYFNFNLGTIDIIPSWWSYIMFFREGIDGIEEEEESVKLLKPIGLGLAIYYLITWFCTMFGVPTDWFLISEIASIVSLYYHFQLLTNLANIAGKYGCEQQQSILNLRTIQTVLLTVLAFTVHFEEIYWLSLGIGVIQIIVVIAICLVLRNFKHALEALPDCVFSQQEGVSSEI